MIDVATGWAATQRGFTLFTRTAQNGRSGAPACSRGVPPTPPRSRDSAPIRSSRNEAQEPCRQRRRDAPGRQPHASSDDGGASDTKARQSSRRPSGTTGYPGNPERSDGRESSVCRPSDGSVKPVGGIAATTLNHPLVARQALRRACASNHPETAGCFTCADGDGQPSVPTRIRLVMMIDAAVASVKE